MLTGRRLLVIAGSASQAQMLQGFCEVWGVESVGFTGAEDVLAELDLSQSIEGALVERCLPGADGVVLAQKIWQQEGLEDLPILLLGDGADLTVEQRERFAGVIAKPSGGGGYGKLCGNCLRP